MSEPSSDRDPLLVPNATARTYGLIPPVDEEQPVERTHHRTHSAGPNILSKAKIGLAGSPRRKETAAADAKKNATEKSTNGNSNNKAGPMRFLYYVVYALVNVIISAPGLYGYAAVIFNHPVFENHMNALSKLVIFSSLIHQLGFFLFSSLDFAIGTVQDAGLIFLSSMANRIADSMLDDGHSEEEIIATTLVLLSLGTALLGVCLIVVGKAGLADAVAYLPMPVVGGYLAFIGYFCCQAGVALCISKALVTFSDWKYLFDTRNIMLAIPGLGAGLVLTLASRKISNDAALPLIMVAIPASFYLLLYYKGETLETAREAGWVGQEAPSVPVSDLIKLVDFSLIQWSCWTKIFSTWCGMVFVVSFASCLDVAAISIDMGEALDTNHELATVGMSNLMSGLTMGFTGSYIFSQTIFTYRTGVHSRWIGVLIMFVFLYIVLSPVNILQIAPLFFLGSTLIFIGYDLLYEWLWEIRHQVFLSEYGIVWLTFVAIQIVGIDAGIILGVLIAVVEQVVLTAKTSTINRIQKRSRAIWNPEEQKILHNHAYNHVAPKIVTMELTGTVFFGSALQLLNRVSEEIGLKGESIPEISDVFHSPRTPHHTPLRAIDRRRNQDRNGVQSPVRPPNYLVLDLLYVTHLDASATRGFFLQLVKICAKHGIIVCASGVTPRIEWMFRSHGVSYKTVEEEVEVKGRLQSRSEERGSSQICDLVLLFVAVQDALEFCEGALLHTYSQQRQLPMMTNLFGPKMQSFTTVLAKMMGASDEERRILARLEEGQRYHEEKDLKKGEVIFHLNTHADFFVVVLQGTVANNSGSPRAILRLKDKVISGAGKVDSRSNLLDPLFLRGQQQKHGSSGDVIAMIWTVGSVVGYLDYLLDRQRLFRLIANKDGTRVAIVNNSHMNLLKSEDPELYGLMQRALLCAATADLANCTCEYS